MKNIHTEIIINATAEKLWAILTNFANYGTWNPFVLSISGSPVVNKKLRVVLKNGNSTSVFKPTVMVAEPNKAFEWEGSLPIPGLFIGRHYFRIEPVNATQVKFVHGENFRGLLAGLIMKQIGEQTMQGFIAMNKALKQQAETA